MITDEQMKKWREICVAARADCKNYQCPICKVWVIYPDSHSHRVRASELICKSYQFTPRRMRMDSADTGTAVSITPLYGSVAADCYICGKPIRVQSAAWYVPGQGLSHDLCYEDEPKSESTDEEGM